MAVAGLAGIPGGNSEVIMAVRSEGAAAMDEAAAVSTAIQPVLPTTGVSTAVPTENFDMGGTEENSLDFSVSPTKDEAATSIFPPASRQRRGEAPPSVATALAVRMRHSSALRPREARRPDRHRGLTAPLLSTVA